MPAFWQGHKERILAGHVHDVFPYEPDKRFIRQRQVRSAQAHDHLQAHSANSVALSK